MHQRFLIPARLCIITSSKRALGLLAAPYSCHLLRRNKKLITPSLGLIIHFFAYLILYCIFVRGGMVEMEITG